MEVLATLATPGRHANVLEQMLGHLGVCFGVRAASP
jgi:hypothetical protein